MSSTTSAAAPSSSHQPEGSDSSVVDDSSAGTSSGHYHYEASDGRAKATLENVFGGWVDAEMLAESADNVGANSSNAADNPWQFGWQINERNLEWNDDLKMRLMQHIASEELGISGAELQRRLILISALLPGLTERLLNAPTQLVIRLAADTQAVATRLVLLKDLFPLADVCAMVSNRLPLLVEDEAASLSAASLRLRELLPGANVDRLVQDFPVILDTDALEVALQDLRRLMPGSDPVSMLRRDPHCITSIMKGKHLIPYDQLANPWS